MIGDASTDHSAHRSVFHDRMSDRANDHKSMVDALLCVASTRNDRANDQDAMADDAEIVRLVIGEKATGHSTYRRLSDVHRGKLVPRCVRRLVVESSHTCKT